ncbi:transmembrane amino acid transporter [Auricularia subglabra TFB-10046 SS5]|nr:transmembrane amino acid transporter [Auricularia subglabra TFB-10046 SS5]
MDVFGDEDGHQIHYKTLSWHFVAMLMIAEIVSNGMLSLPSVLAVVGVIPGVILIVFLGVFAFFTAKLLVDFKLNHPDVHNMGDAGFIIFGRIGREVLSAGTVLFSIAGTGSVLLSGQQALQVLSNNGLCAISLGAIFSCATFLLALPRTLHGLRWLSLLSVMLVLVAGVVNIAGAVVEPVLGRQVDAVLSPNFYNAFVAITNPVFAYAGHFMFFILISEMHRPQDAMKAAWTLQVFATAFYTLFAVVIYVYIGSKVASPAPFSLPPRWSKAVFGIALGNFLFAGSLYAHTAAKLVFVRFFRHSRHIHSHTTLGWLIWTFLVAVAVGVAFVFSISVPIFSYLIGITAALFASWYTYGLAGFFWLHDTYYDFQHGGCDALRRRWFMALLCVLTIFSGAFICVAGTYVSIKLIVDAYAAGLVGKPFTC